MQTVTLLNGKFKDSYNNYKLRIDRVKTETQQEALMSILNEIVQNVNSIDQAHENLLYGNKTALTSISDQRNTIIALRKQLEQRLAALKV